MDFDAIILGSGAGGSAAAHALTAAGRSVLIVEQGVDPSAERRGHDEAFMQIRRGMGDPTPLFHGTRPVRLFTGAALGGSTALYGAALLRPAPEDFTPGRYYGERLPRAFHEWPLGWDEVEPWLAAAEDHLGVAGDAGEIGAPFGTRRRPYAAPAAPLRRGNPARAEALRAMGLRPFRMPSGIQSALCRPCARCPGYVCPLGARRGAREAFLEPSLTAGATLRSRHAAERILWKGTRARAVLLKNLETGERLEVTADRIVVAAGAVGTPALLLRSGTPTDLDWLGRGSMRHLGSVALRIHATDQGFGEDNQKQLAFADWYFGLPDFPHKLGLVQQLPVPGPLTLAAGFGGILPPSAARWLHRRVALWTGMVEDLPRADNRVTLRSDGAPVLHHRFDPYDVFRGRRMTKALARVLGPAALAATAARDVEHAAHQVGTARMGVDPAWSVTDADGKVHGTEGLWIADGSLLPTSLGVGPALLIHALGLRIGSLLAGRTAPAPFATDPGNVAPSGKTAAP